MALIGCPLRRGPISAAQKIIADGPKIPLSPSIILSLLSLLPRPIGLVLFDLRPQLHCSISPRFIFEAKNIKPALERRLVRQTTENKKEKIPKKSGTILPEAETERRLEKKFREDGLHQGDLDFAGLTALFLAEA